MIAGCRRTVRHDNGLPIIFTWVVILPLAGQRIRVAIVSFIFASSICRQPEVAGSSLSRDEYRL